MSSRSSSPLDSPPSVDAPPPKRSCRRSVDASPADAVESPFKRSLSVASGLSDSSALCDRLGCIADAPRCCLRISPTCSKVPRWSHVSQDEHFCINCLDEFSKSNRQYNAQFGRWRAKWLKNSRREPTYRLFVVEELLPYWLRCVDCGKWRQVQCSDGELLGADAKYAPFRCSATGGGGCDASEHAAAGNVGGAQWVGALLSPALQKSSPASSFLKDHYYNDEVGISPTAPTFESQPMDADLVEIVQPFHLPDECTIALCVRPDVMEYDEVVAFAQFASEPTIYLGLRNMIIALWNLNPRVWLTADACEEHVRCRGLVRIFCVKEMERILEFLTIKGVVNFGCFETDIPKTGILNRLTGKVPEVIVVGAGIAGLVAARQLRMFGFKVTVVEAKERRGGRMVDDWSLGVAVGCGAQLVTGVINNPLMIMCHQTRVPYRRVTDKCPLLDAATGRPTDALADRRADFHFNCLLDAVSDWRNATKIDLSLHDVLMDMHEQFAAKSKLKLTADEERALQWQIGNVEFSCGAPLSDVSARHWDQNEQFAQFGGEHALLCHGSDTLLQRLAAHTDVRCNSRVTRIDTRGQKKAVVYLHNGKRLKCDKVLLTTSLSVLKQKSILFTPELPDWKLEAISSLGTGIIEKVAVKFPRKFWADHVQGSDYFGHVPESSESRGLFNMFYDFSSEAVKGRSHKPSYVLMSYLSGESARLVNERTDVQVVDLFVDTLQKLFGDERVPTPEAHVVTHWGRDDCFGMSYSYVRCGATGGHYDTMAKAVDERVYFAGEATNRHFPQTATGACLSALREAGKMFMSTRTALDQV